jgi:hypothetical protein
MLAGWRDVALNCRCNGRLLADSVGEKGQGTDSLSSPAGHLEWSSLRVNERPGFLHSNDGLGAMRGMQRTIHANTRQEMQLRAAILKFACALAYLDEVIAFSPTFDRSISGGSQTSVRNSPSEFVQFPEGILSAPRDIIIIFHYIKLRSSKSIFIMYFFFSNPSKIE